MKDLRFSIFSACVSSALLLAAGFASTQASLAQTLTVPAWQIVVNNGVTVPGDTRTFNSYNQPSVNINGLVVFRGRSKGGTTGEPAHGIFLRNMTAGTAVETLFDRKTAVPQPDDTSATFTEPPSFPRIDIYSNTVASRGSHQPVWEYKIGIDPVSGLPLTTKAGTTGIYTDPFGPLISGANNLGAVPEFALFAVPGAKDLQGNPIKFDVFPGAPAVADKTMIVFKGNYTQTNSDDSTTSKTGVYYRKLTDAPIGTDPAFEHTGGNAPVVRIADTDTLIPGTNTKFGSTAPPSAVGNKAVFAGFDNENAPTKGGIYLATLNDAKLTPLIKIGSPVPTEWGSTFNRIGEGLSFDGRFVAFWGAWGSEVRDLVLQCPTDGNKNVVAYCKELYGDGTTAGSVDLGFHTTVPVHQGIFVHDIISHLTWPVAKTPNNYSDFVYWNFSGKVPPPKGGSGGDGENGEDNTSVVAAAEGPGDSGGMDGETDGEPARWRSASFVAVSGLFDRILFIPIVHTVFKARTGTVTAGAYVNPTDGIYHRPSPLSPISKLVETGMNGIMFDPAATYQPVDELGNPVGPLQPLPVTTMGIERDGFRGNTLVLNIGMGNEEAGWAGIYLTKITK
jgi:hypothetical protein